MIDHAGVIERIEGDRAQVKILSESACGACHAKGVCGAADQEEKLIDVVLPDNRFHEGEAVRVEVAGHMGLKAVAVGYIYPFLLLLAVLIGMLTAGVPEIKSGLIALLSLVPYYLLLFLLRGKIGSTFTFSLQKMKQVQ